MAIYVLVCFDIFGRPSETLRIRKRDILPPVAGMKFSQTVAVSLNARETGVSSETNVYDEVLQFAAGRREAAGVGAMCCARSGAFGEDDWIFEFSYASLSRAFQQACTILRLGNHTLYQLRHGGASTDGANGVPISDIQ